MRAGDARPYFASTGPVAGVRSLGYVAEPDLPGLYAGARAFVLPSRYEGLGLPCLEAMACGMPVVAADRGALPETCGDAALLVDPDDGEAIARALETALDDQTTRDRLRASGLTQGGRVQLGPGRGRATRPAVRAGSAVAPATKPGAAQFGIRPSPWNSALASSSDTSGGGRMMSDPTSSSRRRADVRGRARSAAGGRRHRGSAASSDVSQAATAALSSSLSAAAVGVVDLVLALVRDPDDHCACS